MTVNIVVLADPHGACVAELTPDGVFVRPVEEGVAGCANHFLHPETRHDASRTGSGRWTGRRPWIGLRPPVGPRSAWERCGRPLDQVNQGELTVQSMVFEPAVRAVHVAFGPGPATDYRPVRLNLAELLA